MIRPGTGTGTVGINILATAAAANNQEGVLNNEEICGNSKRDGKETKTDVEICGNSSCDSGSVAAI